MPTTRLLDPDILARPDRAIDFLVGLLESSTEYSIIGTDDDGTIRLWNEGARRVYGYEPEEVVGKMSALDLHVADDVASGLVARLTATVSAEGKWEGNLNRRRADGTEFTARVVITSRHDPSGTSGGHLVMSKDITQEARTADQLEEIQAYTRSLIESNIDALMTTDPLGLITDVNEQMVTLTGVSRDRLVGTPFKDYFTDPDLAEAGIRQVLTEGRVTDYELTVRRAGGADTVVSYNASTFYDQAGRLRGVFAAARDVTRQRDLERQLREQQTYLRGLIEASVDGLVTVDPGGRITDVNDTMCSMVGYSRAELVGTAFADYFTEPERATAGVGQTFAQGTVTDYRLTAARAGGATIDVSFNASVYSDEAGEPQGIFASARDVTDASRLQTQLGEERAYNRGLIEASVDGLVTVDALLAVTDVNDTFCRMTGFTRQELVGSQFPGYFTDPAQAAEGVRLTLERGDVSGYELTMRPKNGDERLVSFNAAVFRGADGAVRGIFASARDVTDQAQLRQALDQERTYNRGLIEASVDGLVTVDPAGKVTDVNDTFCALAGRRRDQLLGSPFADLFSEPEAATAGVRLTLEEGVVRDYVLTLVSPSGSTVPVSFNATALRQDGEGAQGIFASARDVTRQRELEAELQETQTYTRSLIESNIDALMTTDPLGIITDVNEQMVALTGVARDELVGSAFKRHFTDPDRAEAGIRQVLTEGRVTDYELTARAADGRETVVSYNASTFYDQAGRLRGVFAAARDVTRQKALERQLREQQAYLRGLIEASVDGLVTVDPDGFVTDVNDTMCRMVGYPRGELVGTLFADYFTEPEQANAGVRLTFEEGSVTEYALTMRAKGRRQLDVSFNASVYRDPHGEPQGIFASARDVTERTRLEEQLREQQAYLRGLIESSVDGLVTVNPEGRVTDVNERFCRMTGADRAELVGSRFSGHFTDAAAADLGVRRTLAEGVVTDYQLELVSQAGRKMVVSFNASTYRNPSGRLEGIFASARDISAQARLARELAEQQAYNRSLIEASADALFAIDPEGVVTDINEEATRLTGYSRRHLTNLPFAALFTEPAEARRGVEQAFADGRVLAYELVLHTASGAPVTVSFNAGVFRDGDMEPLGILASARDVTRQKELEAELKETQAYTRSLIESNIDALMTTDPLGIITDVNEQMVALTGAEREALIGSRFKEYFTDPVRAEAGIRQVLTEGKVTNYELTARAADSTETVVSYNASTFYDQAGRLRGVFAAARDVTETKEAEEGVRRAHDDAERANLAKSEFLSRMSHELRTPLNAILGFTELLGLEELGEEAGGWTGQIDRAGQHLLHLINDVLDISRIESGHLVLSMEPVAVESVVNEVFHLVSPARDALDLSVESQVSADTFVLADRNRLKQVVLNLVSNACKYNRRGGTVTVRASHERGRVVIKVTDTGAGMKPERLQDLFVPFARLGAERSKIEGTGLGLALSRGLVEEMGGHLGVESAGPEGSTFRLDLSPAEAPASDHGGDWEVEGDALDFPVLSLVKAAIVYVEDNPANFQLVAGALARFPELTLLGAVEGQEGLDLIRRTLPAVVLLDLHLPDMSGLEVLAELRKSELTQDIPVVVLTADAMTLRAGAVIAAGARAHLTKPFRLRDFLQILEDCTARPEVAASSEPAT